MTELTLQCPIRVGIVEAENVTVSKGSSAYEQLEQCADRYREIYNDQTKPGDVEGIQVARRLYRALKIDPTKTRPSSEALLRRVLKGKSLYAVNTLVDVGNWVSLDSLLSLGLYDQRKIEGAVCLRQGRDGEMYEGIGKPPVNVAGRYVLADGKGPFGSPTSDSQRTSITTETSKTLMVLFTPNDYPKDKLLRVSQTAAERILQHCGGNTTRVAVVE